MNFSQCPDLLLKKNLGKPALQGPVSEGKEQIFFRVSVMKKNILATMAVNIVNIQHHFMPKMGENCVSPSLFAVFP